MNETNITIFFVNNEKKIKINNKIQVFISFDQLDYRFTKVGINCWSIHWTTTNKLSYLLVHTVVTS